MVIENQIIKGEVDGLSGAMYLPSKHWVSVVIDFEHQKIFYGDSLGWKIPDHEHHALQTWIKYLVGWSIKFPPYDKITFDQLSTRHQFDGTLWEEMGWSLCHATCPGKKTPENVTQVLTNAALHLVSTISKHDVPKSLLVNSYQTGVTYSAGGLATWAPINSKQVEVLGKDEWQTFTLMVDISMSGEVLPYQAIYSRKTPASLPTDKAPDYTKATQELKFRLESSGTDTYWSTIKTMQIYVINILVPYFESHCKNTSTNLTSCVFGKLAVGLSTNQ